MAPWRARTHTHEHTGDNDDDSGDNRDIRTSPTHVMRARARALCWPTYAQTLKQGRFRPRGIKVALDFSKRDSCLPSE